MEDMMKHILFWMAMAFVILVGSAVILGIILGIGYFLVRCCLISSIQTYQKDVKEYRKHKSKGEIHPLTVCIVKVIGSLYLLTMYLLIVGLFVADVAGNL